MLENILPVLREASKAILEVYADEEKFRTEIKGDHSPLTEADKASNTIICNALADLYPDIPVISEETRQAGYDIRQTYKTCFLVDPLDGTKEFIKRNGEFTINIGYVEGQRPMGGFLYVPCTDMAYAAIYGEGAWKIDRDDHRTEIQCSTFSLRDKGLRILASRSHRDPMTESIIAKLDAPEIHAVGSALKFIRIAEGLADFYPRLAPTMEWDTSAAQCILEEAGGAVVKYDGLLPLIYNKPDLLNPHFLAFGSIVDPEQLSAILPKNEESR